MFSEFCSLVLLTLLLPLRESGSFLHLVARSLHSTMPTFEDASKSVSWFPEAAGLSSLELSFPVDLSILCAFVCLSKGGKVCRHVLVLTVEAGAWH